MNSTVIEIDNEPQPTVEYALLKSSLAEGPAALPAHILAVGEHHRLAGSTWWIGCARAAYEEVTHLHGIVIYNRNTHLFLLQEEAREALALMQQELFGANL